MTYPKFANTPPAAEVANFIVKPLLLAEVTVMFGVSELTGPYIGVVTTPFPS